MAILVVYNVTVFYYIVKKRPLDKEEEHSDNNNLYYDVTPTPNKVTLIQRLVKKSQKLPLILHNSSVSCCIAYRILEYIWLPS